MELCRLAIERGWITPREIDVVLRERDVESAATLGTRNIKPMGILLVAHGFLTDVQLRELQEQLRNRGVRPIFDRTLLGQLLLEDKLITREALDQALEAQRNHAAQGRRRRIGEILVEMKCVEASAVIAALRKQRKEILECPGCSARFNVFDYASTGRYACPKCNSQLRAGTMLLDVDDTTIGIKPASEADLPATVAAQTGPKVHFGKFVVMRELFRSAEGPVHLGWQKDQGRFVALLFLAADPPTGYAGKIAVRFTHEAQSHQVRLAGFLESGAYEGRRYVSWGLQEVPGTQGSAPTST